MRSEKTPSQNSKKIRPCGRCICCQCFSYCNKAELPVISDAMLSNPAWLRHARNFASSLGIPGALWPNEIFNLWRDMKVSVPNDFNIETLFLPPDDADGEEIHRFTEALRDWCKYFLNGPVISENITPYVTAARREHARCIFALLASHDPDEFESWGQR